MLLMVQLREETWNMGRTITVVPLSSISLMLGWSTWAMLDTMFLWVSITPLGTPVVPEL